MSFKIGQIYKVTNGDSATGTDIWQGCLVRIRKSHDKRSYMAWGDIISRSPNLSRPHVYLNWCFAKSNLTLATPLDQLLYS